MNGDSLVGDIGKINNHNMFIYCNNKPTIMADYNGLYPLQFANELLDRWLNGKDDVVIFEEDSRIVKLLKKSKKIQSHIEAAIKDYEDGYPHHLGSDEFTLEDDGAELFLAVQHYRYSLETREEFRTIITSEGIRDQKRYTTVVIIDDVYDFDGFREGFTVPNLLNNFAYFYSCMVGAHDYYWAAIYEHTTEWKNIN